ncbi:MAG: hydroxymethylglutaryl-CoA synthase family protein [Promethearchaeia archaeon]
MLKNNHLFSEIGIDSVGFYAPRYYISLEELAEQRDVDPEKYTKGLLSREMRLPGQGEDIITLGLKAGYYALQKGNIRPEEIDALFVGTETVTYAAKSVANIFADYLGISKNSFTQDIYNACAGGTLAILNAIGLIEKGVINKALVICADISSYKLNSPSEPTQGSGAIAMVICKNPRVAVFSKRFGRVSSNINDFYRLPNEENAKVFGKYSVKAYLNFQLQAYDDLMDNIGDFHADYYTFHAPFAKLPIKCMRQIIQKRWIKHINNLPKFKVRGFISSILRKLDNFLHDFTVLPEYIYLKLRERGYSSRVLEDVSHWLIDNVKAKVLPQLRVPSHFGNMYNAAIWSQIIYILENYGKPGNTIYFGSYGSGATCISGLLKIQRGYQKVVRKPPYINDFIKIKERKSIYEYEQLKEGFLKSKIYLGEIVEHEENHHRGFTLHFCDEGCIIPNIEGLNYCPQGHKGFHTKFFPLYAVLNSEPIVLENLKNCSFLSKGLVRITHNLERGSNLEYELRRVENKDAQNFNADGLLNWVPSYSPTREVF